MTFEQMHNYRMAVTEREVINGCLSVGPKHKYCNNVKVHILVQHDISNKYHSDKMKFQNPNRTMLSYTQELSTTSTYKT